MESLIPNIKLNNGLDIPIVGLGTWKSNPGEVVEAVKIAIDVGYRHIDCAALYFNEREVGEALKAKMDEGVVKREDIFITSKVWCNSHSKQGVITALKRTLSDLGLDYLDLYLIHHPVGLQEGEDLFPANPEGNPCKPYIFSDVDYLETWEAMEEAVALGLVKSIGVSNFNIEQIDRLLTAAKIPPVTNQIEVSPYFTNVELVDFCSSKGIIITGYSCFGSSPTSLGSLIDTPQPYILEDKVLKKISEKYKKGVAQVILRWAIQRNIVVIPKSVSRKRIEDNLNVFDFTLTSQEIKEINGLNRNARTLIISWAKTHKYYPFAQIPNVQLNDGRRMPIIGLGTYQVSAGEVTQAVKDAIDSGYRHIDCAMLYANEPEVGGAIRAKIDEGVVKREDLFLTSKLWSTYHSKGLVIPTLKRTLKDLGVDYLDMYLMHWPMGLQEGGELLPWLPDGTLAPSEVDYLETWEAMEEALELGLAKSIGVSNFNSEQLDRLLKVAKIQPAINQFEVSPYLTNLKLVEFCQSKGIAVTGYRTFGGTPDASGAKSDDTNPLQDPILIQLGEKHNKSPAQIILRWAVQHNIIIIPKSVSKKRRGDNIDIFDFTLSRDEMNQIDGLNRNLRAASMSSCSGHKFYPFNIEF